MSMQGPALDALADADRSTVLPNLSELKAAAALVYAVMPPTPQYT